MACKLISFLIVASVVQCFCDQSSIAPAVLSDADWANLLVLQDYYNATLTNELKFFGDFFDSLANRIICRANNATSTNYNETAENGDAVSPVELAVQYSFEAVVAAVGVTTCDAANKNLDVASSLLVDGLQRITGALTLAETSNGNETASAIEEYRNPALSDFLELLDKIYSSISECRNETSAEVLEVIKLGQRRSDYGFTRIINAVFNAIKEYAAAVAEQSVDMRLLTKVEGHRATVILSDVTQVGGKFAVLEAIFIYYNQKTDLSIGDLYLIGLNRTGNRNAAAIADLAELSEFVDLAADDAVADEAINKWVAETYQMLKTTETLSRQEIPDAANVVAAMEDIITKVRAVAVKYTVTFFNYALINPSGTIKDITYKFTTLETAAEAEFKIMTDGIAKANDYISKASKTNNTTNLMSDICAVQTAVIAAVHRVSDMFSY